MTSVLLASLVTALSPMLDGGTTLTTDSSREQTLEVLISPTFSMEAGARSIASLETLVFFYDDVLRSRVAFDDSTRLARGVAIGARTLKLALLDAPLVLFFTALQHEVFGHGARARELGFWPSFWFQLPPPYSLLSPTQQHGAFTEGRFWNSIDAELAFTAGGIEANVLDGYLTAMRGLRAGRMHYAAELHYLASHAAYFTRILDPRVIGSDAANGSDPDVYVLDLMTRFNQSGSKAMVTNSQRLRRAWLTQFADPLMWISLVHLVIGHIGQGSRWLDIPRVKLGPLAVLPMTRFNLSPFGGEHYVDLTFAHHDFLLETHVRFVSSGLATALGFGARIFSWKLKPWLELGGSFDVWTQPRLVTGDGGRNFFDRPQQAGLSVVVEGTWRPLHAVGIVAQAGGKSNGAVMGQPFDAGFFGLVGLALYVDRPTSQ